MSAADPLGAELASIAAVEAFAQQDLTALGVLIDNADRATVRELALLAYTFALASVGPERLPELPPAELARQLTSDVLDQLAVYRRAALARLQTNPIRGGDHA